MNIYACGQRTGNPRNMLEACVEATTTSSVGFDTLPHASHTKLHTPLRLSFLFCLDVETKSAGLSPAREAVLELLLRRMSDPGQLVELVSHIPQPDSSTPSAGTNTAEANPFMPPSPVAAAGSSASMTEPVSSGNVDIAKTAAVTVAAPSPSAIELQCLLLSVATAEGVSKIKALQQGGAGRGGKARGGGKDSRQESLEEGAVQGGVGEAAVEMLGRLTNQLLSR